MTSALDEVGERITALLADVEGRDPHAAERTRELLSLVLQVHADGLARMLEILADADGDLPRTLADDELVEALLVLHDLHPVPLKTRVQAALDEVRPYLGSHGGDVSVAAIDGDVVRVRLGGTCDGCPSSSATMTLAIEQAVLRATPEIARVEAVDEQAAPGLHQITGLRPRRDTTGAGRWVQLDRPDAPLAGRRVDDVDLVLCRVGDTRYAYRDRCAACDASFAGARLDDGVLRCGSCGHGFDVRAAGQPVDAAAPGPLDPFPLLDDDEGLRVAVPQPA